MMGVIDVVLVDMETYFRIAEPQGIRLDSERPVRTAQVTTSRRCPFQRTRCAKNVTWARRATVLFAFALKNNLKWL